MGKTTREFTVSFITPAFLGDAEQKATWRTPPFKALLRQWWRILKAKDFGYDHEELREAEGLLFGNAWLEGGERGSHQNQKNRFCKSDVLIRLEPWKEGQLKEWKPTEKVFHPEVREGMKIGADLYLGYGPLGYDRSDRKTKLQRTAIEPLRESAKLALAYPDAFQTEIDNALKLIHLFGTLGGRSRNGWGSLFFQDEQKLNGLGEQAWQELLDCKFNGWLHPLSRPLGDCLQLDWPHAIGKDEKGLFIWKTDDFASWEEAITKLAETKIAFRTVLQFTQSPGTLDKRHILAYPVTHHLVNGWERLANQMRFKVIKSKDRFFGLIMHLPCKVPKALTDKHPSDPQGVLQKQEKIWKGVHNTLDGGHGIRRLKKEG